VIDVTTLEAGHTIHVKEIPMDAYAGLSIMDEPDTPVVTIMAPKKDIETPGEA